MTNTDLKKAIQAFYNIPENCFYQGDRGRTLAGWLRDGDSFVGEQTVWFPNEASGLSSAEHSFLLSLRAVNLSYTLWWREEGEEGEEGEVVSKRYHWRNGRPLQRS